MSDTEKLPTSPDWNLYPDIWIYFAIDGDGNGVLYTHKPERMNAGFCQPKGNYFEIGKHFDATNWKSSLQKRPVQ